MKTIEESIQGLFKHAASGNAAVIAFRILLALLVLFICSRIINAICKRLQKAMNKKTDVDQGAVVFVTSAIKVLLYLAVILMILNGLGVKTSSLLTLLGSIGLAIVLGLKDNLSNVASGIIIMVLKPFNVGDHIIENSDHNEGTVTEIGLFFTKLKTLDEQTIIIPNQLLTNSSVINQTREQYRTLDLHYSIPYGTDLDTAKEIIRKTVMDDPETNKDRGEDSVHVFVHSLDDSAVILCSRSRVINEKYWQTRYRIFESVYKNFMAEGLEFAYPHMDVHVDQNQY